MNFYINGKILYRNITGVERYARETINEIDKIAENLSLFIAIPKDYNDRILEFKNIKTIKINGSSSGFLWDQYTLPKFAK